MKHLIIILTLFIGSASFAQSNGTDIELVIAPTQDQCMDQNDEQYDCFKAKKTTDPHWTFTIPEIIDFDYESGFTYTLKIRLSTAEEVQKDGTNAKYTLVEVLDKRSN